MPHSLFKIPYQFVRKNQQYSSVTGQNARNLLEATNTNRKAIITFLMGKLFIVASSYRGTGKALNRNKYHNCLEDTFKAQNNADNKCCGTRGREEIRVLAKGAY